MLKSLNQAKTCIFSEPFGSVQHYVFELYTCLALSFFTLAPLALKPPGDSSVEDISFGVKGWGCLLLLLKCFCCFLHFSFAQSHFPLVVLNIGRETELQKVLGADSEQA